MLLITLPCLGLLLCLAVPADALEVNARLDAGSIRPGETVQLVLESDAQPTTGPDLAPLSQDFRIVGRSSSRLIREVNGRREEHHELRLTLSPLWTGGLEVPAIAFGEAVTQPLRLDVGVAGIERGSLEPSLVTSTAGTPTPPPPREGTGPAKVPIFQPPREIKPLAGDWQGLETSRLPAGTSSPQSLSTSTVEPALPAPVEAGTPSSWSRILIGWLGFLTGLAGLALLGLGWRRGRGWASGRPIGYLQTNQESAGISDHGRGTPSTAQGNFRPGNFDTQQQGRHTETEEDNAGLYDTGQDFPRRPVDPLAEAVAEVRRAYTGGEAAAARNALLAWAALVMPERPPGNLALLAKRCRDPLRSEILILEQAFFSPHPLDWDHRRVWERLPAFEPLPPAEPASFRQKRPLRRHQTPA